MASHMVPIAFLLFISLLLPSSIGAAEVICEDLPVDLCAFSISSTGQRCLLESYRTKEGGEPMKYQCKASEVVVERVWNWIESDECVKACGADRTSNGISSDALLDSQFTGMLCSSTCYESCPNIVDLYFNLAAAEGVFLPDLCQARRSNTRRSMVDLLSSGAASGPTAAAVEVADEFAPSPSA